MAAKIGVPVRTKSYKKTSIGSKNRKMSSMNKSTKRSYKKYRGQGK